MPYAIPVLTGFSETCIWLLDTPFAGTRQSLRRWFDDSSSDAASAPGPTLRSAWLCMGTIYGTDLHQKKKKKKIPPQHQRPVFSVGICAESECLKKYLYQHGAGRVKGLGPNTWRGRGGNFLRWFSWYKLTHCPAPVVYLHHCCSDSCLCSIHQI